jgi:hypothetical protein
MKRTALQADAIATTYEDMEMLIFDTVHKFIHQNGGDFDDLIGQASLSFMYAWQTRDRSKAKFTTWLRWVVWHDLLTLVRNRARHAGKVVFTDLDPEAFAAPREFDKVEFLDSLGDDAWFVAKCVLDTPRELRWLMEREPLMIRVALREYLRALKWEAQRIRQAFTEIRQMLAGDRPYVKHEPFAGESPAAVCVLTPRNKKDRQRRS